jgi:hypothetical protein
MPVRESDLILVCLVPSPRDLEIARLLGWYRIPLRTAPKVVAVDHLAFYQPAAFGEAGGRIDFTAPVRGHELTTRAELLKDEARHPRAHEEYYRLQVGGFERLPASITADKWRRVTFLYTTGEYLLRARTLHDLVVESDERALLWRTLRDRAESAQQYRADMPEVEVSPDVLMALLGIKDGQGDYDPVELD